jgi:branched-chain amino acid transport system substrate-binding protein
MAALLLSHRVALTTKLPPVFHTGRQLLAFLLLAAFLLGSCVSVRPIVKIGVLAPFEGLYRRTGYTVLEAVRRAIVDDSAANPAVFDLLPLALDDSAAPAAARRSTQKLLVDPGVGAVVGPLTPALAAATGDLLAPASVAWRTPFALNWATGRFESPDEAGWAEVQVAAAAVHLQAQGVGRLALAGMGAGWPQRDAAAWALVAGMPVQVVAGAAEIRPGDGLFFAGPADEAARFLDELWARRPEIPAVVTLAGGDPILRERLQIVGRIDWMAWESVEYNRWAGTEDPAMIPAHTTYLATLDLLHQLRGGSPAPRKGQVIFVPPVAGVTR